MPLLSHTIFIIIFGSHSYMWWISCLLSSHGLSSKSNTTFPAILMVMRSTGDYICTIQATQRALIRKLLTAEWRHHEDFLLQEEAAKSRIQPGYWERCYLWQSWVPIGGILEYILVIIWAS